MRYILSMIKSPPPLKNYYPQLDGLRGLAALTVFFSHTMGFFSASPLIIYLQQSPLRTFWDGAAAVDLFFVLSGFVLTLPFISGVKKINYFHYVIRRLFRLYPAYYLALVVSLSLRYIYSPLDLYPLNEWAQSFWTNQDPITLKLIATHPTLVLKTNTHAIDPVVWTLFTEMKMSLLLPLFMYLLLCNQDFFYQTCLVIGVFILVGYTGKIGAFPLFALGAYLASNLNFFSRRIKQMSKIYLLTAFMTTFCLYGNRWILPTNQYESLLTGIASFLIIVAVINLNSLKMLLQARLFIFLGKTSYSFYLLHLPILLVITSLFYHKTNSLLICALITLTVTYSLAYIIYLLIELPAIELGRRLTVNKIFK